MNHQHQDNTIKEAFRRLKQADEQGAPDFDRIWELVSSRPRIREHRRLVPALVAAALSVVALVGVWRTWVNKPIEAEPITTSAPPLSTPMKGISVGATPEPARARSRPKRKVVTLISDWRSPTDFLLRSPADDLLKATPRVGDSLLQTRQADLEDKN